MNDLTKLSITKDSFLFSVNQAYEARIKQDGSFQSHLIYEPFLEKTWSLPEKPDTHSLKKTLASIIEHHYEKLPNYRREEDVNIENVSWFSHSEAALFADIEHLLFAYTGYGFPFLPNAKIPRTNSSKNIQKAIEKFATFQAKNNTEEKFELFPLLDENDVPIEQQFTEEVWSLIFYFIKKYFGPYTELMSLYATWKYVVAPVNTEVVDWNVRPPCGELYRKQFKHLFERDYFKNNPSKSSSGDKKHDSKWKKDSPAVNATASETEEIEQEPKFKPRPTGGESKPPFTPQARPEFQERADRPQREDRPRRNDRPQRDDRPHRGDRPQREDRPNRGDRPERPRRGDQEELVKQAIEEASKGVEKMKKNPKLNELSLSPQNSFLRRQQHVVISEGGFETESRGEDENRHVCIKRK